MKIIPSFNIGYSSKGIGEHSLTNFPICFPEMTIKEFSKNIREQVETIYGYAKGSLVPPSAMCLFINFKQDEYEWEWHIMMKNVREYKALLHSDKNVQESDTTEAE